MDLGKLIKIDFTDKTLERLDNLADRVGDFVEKFESFYRDFGPWFRAFEESEEFQEVMRAVSEDRAIQARCERLDERFVSKRAMEELLSRAGMEIMGDDGVNLTFRVRESRCSLPVCEECGEQASVADCKDHNWCSEHAGFGAGDLREIE